MTDKEIELFIRKTVELEQSNLDLDSLPPGTHIASHRTGRQRAVREVIKILADILNKPMKNNENVTKYYERCFLKEST